MTALLATVLLWGAQAPEPPALPIAVTKSGMRVQCTAETTVGARRIQTPYGSLLVATDPVAEIVDGTRQRQDLDRLRADGLIDEETWLRDLSTAGQLEAMVQAADRLMVEQPQQLYPVEVLEDWGRRLDPVAPGVDYEDRVGWLWDEAMDARGSRCLMLGARLREEVSRSETPQFERKVSISTLRKGLRSRHAERVRVAALIAGRQQEFSMRESLMQASLRSQSEAARDGAAEAIHEVHPHAARQYWVRNLANGEEHDRELAARNLGRYGGDEALEALMHVLAAWERKAPKRFDFHGRTIWVVTTTDRMAYESVSFDGRRLDDDDWRVLPEDLEFLELGTTLKVGRFGEALHSALLEALDQVVGETTGRGQEEWLAWYAETWLPTHP